MRSRSCFVIFALSILSPFLLASEGNEHRKDIPASGSFKPAGPPEQGATRVDAGKSCVVDIEQSYIVSGTLSGAFEVDFRILVAGPCGSPLGTFDETWIALGKFVGTVAGASASATFTYTAQVEAGGEVDGTIVLGQGLDGSLQVHGKFGDGKLSYDGTLLRIPD